MFGGIGLRVRVSMQALGLECFEYRLRSYVQIIPCFTHGWRSHIWTAPQISEIRLKERLTRRYLCLIPLVIRGATGVALILQQVSFTLPDLSCTGIQ